MYVVNWIAHAFTQGDLPWNPAQHDSVVEEKTMKSKFASRLRVLAALSLVAIILAACGGSGGTTTTGSTSGSTLASGASFKLGVSLTFNNTDFWTNYISYETK